MTQEQFNASVNAEIQRRMQAAADRCACEPGRADDGSEFGPCTFCEAAADSAASLTLEADPLATAVLAAVAARIEPTVRNIGDRIYDDIMVTVQDYLTDNVTFNVGQSLAAAARETQRLRDAHRDAVDDRDELREMLDDLRLCRSEQQSIGGGPGWKEREAKAWARVEEYFQP